MLSQGLEAAVSVSVELSALDVVEFLAVEVSIDSTDAVVGVMPPAGVVPPAGAPEERGGCEQDDRTAIATSSVDALGESIAYPVVLSLLLQ
jgi:hypothetical protein